MTLDSKKSQVLKVGETWLQLVIIYLNLAFSFILIEDYEK